MVHLFFLRLTRDVSKHSDLSPAKDRESSKVLNIFTRLLTLGDPEGVRLIAGGLGNQTLASPPEGPYTLPNARVTGISFFFTRK